MTYQTKLACATLILLIITVFILMVLVITIRQRNVIKICTKIKSLKRMDQFDAKNLFLLAVLQKNENNNYKVNCGAVTLSGFWALSTASCIIHSEIRKTFLRSNTPYWITQSTIYSIDKVVFHENYVTAKYNNLALIKTHRPFILESVTPIVVPHQTDLETYTQIVGWQTDQPYKLVIIEIHAVKTCSEYLNKTNITTTSSICVIEARPLNALKYVLHPGAALITGRKILGFAHSNITYHRGAVYGMFINVSMWYKWIHKKMCTYGSLL